VFSYTFPTILSDTATTTRVCGRKYKKNTREIAGVLPVLLFMQSDVFFAVLEVDAAEGGRDFGAEVTAVEGEDAWIVNLLLGLYVINTYGASVICNNAVALKVCGAIADAIACG